MSHVVVVQMQTITLNTVFRSIRKVEWKKGFRVSRVWIEGQTLILMMWGSFNFFPYLPPLLLCPSMSVTLGITITFLPSTTARLFAHVYLQDVWLGGIFPLLSTYLLPYPLWSFPILVSVSCSAFFPPSSDNPSGHNLMQCVCVCVCVCLSL